MDLEFHGWCGSLIDGMDLLFCLQPSGCPISSWAFSGGQVPTKVSFEPNAFSVAVPWHVIVLFSDASCRHGRVCPMGAGAERERV